MTIPNNSEKKRPQCPRCHSPLSRCLCAFCPQNLHLEFPIVIFQHPDEEHHYLNTVKILNLSLNNVQLIITDGPSEKDLDPSFNWFLLFPGEKTESLSQVSKLIEEKKFGLVILDGTWKKTKRFIFENIFLEKLPRLSLQKSYESIYELRKCDRQNFLSTLEAFSYLLIENQQTALGEELISRMKIMIQEQKKRFQEPSE